MWGAMPLRVMPPPNAIAGSLRPLPQRGPSVWELRCGAGLDQARPVDDQGKPRYRRVSRTFRGTRRQATAALQALVAEVEAQANISTTDSTVGEMLDAWLAFDGTT